MNLKAELEIMSPHDKIGMLRQQQQWEELIEIQKEKIRLLGALVERGK